MKQRVFNARIIKFIGCGCLSASTEFLVFIAIAQFMPAYFSALVSFLCGLMVSFLLNKVFVFKSDAKKRDATKEASKFLVLGLINSQISSGITVGLVTIIANGTVVKIITMIVIAVWNYVIMSKLIFKTKPNITERD
jgi:putative flippase GtrA